MGEPLAGFVIDMIGGNCPVQAEGTFDGVPFYFRARHDEWSIGVGGDTVADPDWQASEPYGVGEFDAGWMPVEEARTFIAQAYVAWKAAALPVTLPNEETPRG